MPNLIPEGEQGRALSCGSSEEQVVHTRPPCATSPANFHTYIIIIIIIIIITTTTTTTTTTIIIIAVIFSLLLLYYFN